MMYLLGFLSGVLLTSLPLVFLYLKYKSLQHLLNCAMDHNKTLLVEMASMLEKQKSQSQ